MTAVLAVAGILLIVLPIAFNVAFALLAARFDYPGILRRPTAEVLERFRVGGPGLVLLWWGFAFTAVLLAPVAALVSSALTGAVPAIVQTGLVIGVLASIVQFLGLVRWPFLVPYLARTSAQAPAGSPERAAAEVVFQSMNRYLGVAVGEHLGYLFSGAWTILVGVGILQSQAVTWWLGLAGIVVGAVLALCAFEFVGPFEDRGWKLAGAVTPIAYIAWSAWLAGLGAALLVAAFA